MSRRVAVYDTLKPVSAMGVGGAPTIGMSQDGRLPPYRNHCDKRFRLAKIKDVKRLARPVPAE